MATLMLTHDSLKTLDLMVRVCNIGVRDEPFIETPAQLDAMLKPYSITGSRTHDELELQEFMQLQPRFRALWDAVRDQAAIMLNQFLNEAGATPQLVRHDDLDWHVHAVAWDRPLATRIAMDAAMAFVDLVRLDAVVRCKHCTADHCEKRFLDLSRNASRRFCGNSCQSRTNVAAFRARKAAS